MIKNYPAKVLFGDITFKRLYDGMLMVSPILAPEESARGMFHSQSIPSQENSFSGSNVGGWNNNKIDGLIEKYETDWDPKKRKLYVNLVVDEYMQNYIAIPLYFDSQAAVIPKRIEGFNLAPHNYYETNQAEYWAFSK